MTSHLREVPIDRLENLPRMRRVGAIPWACSTNFTAIDEDVLDEPRPWNFELGHAPWRAGAEYRYQLGSHQLVLTTRGLTGHCEAAVARAEAEFALVVEWPLLVFGYRFGDVVPWSWTGPYSWHFEPPTKRVVPAAIPLTPETYSRLWSTLWITLLDDDDGRLRAHRAVVLRPEFTHALHGMLRAQALRPFRGVLADRAMDRIRHLGATLLARTHARTKCAAVSDNGGRAHWFPGVHVVRSLDILRRQHDATRHQDANRHHRWVMDAYTSCSGIPLPLPGATR